VKGSRGIGQWVTVTSTLRKQMTTHHIAGARGPAPATASAPLSKGLTAPSDDVDTLQRSLSHPHAFTGIFDSYFFELHRYVARRLGTDAADDIVADTFLVAFKSRHRFDADRGTVRAWLYGIVTNHIRRRNRQEVRAYRALSRIGIPLDTESHEDRVTALVSAQSVGHRLARALAALSRGDRDVLLLVALAELNYDEVAQSLGIPYGTVCSRLSRARRKVRKALGETDPTSSED
jgi:RNA polymerase sigma-70 factor (ECF subfamily)